MHDLLLLASLLLVEASYFLMVKIMQICYSVFKKIQQRTKCIHNTNTYHLTFKTSWATPEHSFRLLPGHLIGLMSGYERIFGVSPLLVTWQLSVYSHVTLAQSLDPVLPACLRFLRLKWG